MSCWQKARFQGWGVKCCLVSRLLREEKSIFCVRTETSGVISVFVAHNWPVFYITRHHKLHNRCSLVLDSHSAYLFSGTDVSPFHLKNVLVCMIIFNFSEEIRDSLCIYWQFFSISLTKQHSVHKLVLKYLLLNWLWEMQIYRIYKSL